jgi:trimethylamine--corrinoid protein Co-methyltransferase
VGALVGSQVMSEGSGRRKSGGRNARRAARAEAQAPISAFIERKIPYLDYLNEESLQLIEHNADTVLEEIGIEFRDDAEALALLKDAGADVTGERVRFPRGMCRSIIQAHAPREFVQHARNPERNVIIGGDRTVLVPGYGSPFVRDLEGAPLRHPRGLSEFCEAGLHGAGLTPFRGYRV